jgi:SAM-dependent methyltransferase
VELPMTRWSESADKPTGTAYAARFARLAEGGMDMHGEATLCASLVPPGSRVLDAGCGTGRVAIRLAGLGYVCVGVDSDASMLAVAREAAPDLTWVGADLAALDAVELGGPFDLVVMAGNIVPLLAEGTEATVVGALASRLTSGGHLVAGFGLDRAHLPLGAALIAIDDYDSWCAAAGLVASARWATWDEQRWTADAGYAVSVHRR